MYIYIYIYICICIYIFIYILSANGTRSMFGEGVCAERLTHGTSTQSTLTNHGTEPTKCMRAGARGGFIARAATNANQRGVVR